MRILSRVMDPPGPLCPLEGGDDLPTTLWGDGHGSTWKSYIEGRYCTASGTYADPSEHLLVHAPNRLHATHLFCPTTSIMSYVLSTNEQSPMAESASTR